MAAMRIAALLAFSLVAFAEPPLEPSVRVCDQQAGREVPLAAMLDSLAKVDAVFFGETHLDETTHRLEHAVLEGLAARREGKVVLAMEMFERDVQPVLDRYLKGEIEESEFLAQARPWPNYPTAYRPMIEFAKAKGLPVVASNVPAGIRRKVGFGGPPALEALPADERALLPKELLPNTDAYWDRVARTLRGHFFMVATPERRLTSSQSLWDNTMGESCALALEAHPGHLVFHVNGGFHSQYRDGTVHQLLLRRPDTKVAVIEAIATDDPQYDPEPFGAMKRADYLLLAQARGREAQEEFHAVAVGGELRFRLHLPHGAKDAPLLIWLCDDGFRAEDGLDLLRAAIGGDLAIAAIEPPHPLLNDDLTQGGRWFEAETFQEDLGTLHTGLSRLKDYLLRSYPIDPARIVVAGEGTGATVVAAGALYLPEFQGTTVACAPRRFTKLRMQPLPSPEMKRAATQKLAILPLPADVEWWTKEGGDWGETGLAVEVVPAAADAWARLRQLRGHLWTALNMEAPDVAEPDPRPLLVLETDTPRARFWAHRRALRLEAEVVARPELARFREARPDTTYDERVLGPVAAADLADGKGIPLAAGPFGGTTVLVVPDGATEEERLAFRKLEADNVLHRRSRFASLAVVANDAELAAALEKVKASGRTSVLVVPAVFCADAERMARLAKAAAPWEDTLDLQFLPGLGGEG